MDLFGLPTLRQGSPGAEAPLTSGQQSKYWFKCGLEAF